MPDGAMADLVAMSRLGVLPRRHWLRRAAGLAILALLAWLAWEMVHNRAFGWDVFAHYVFAPDILRGLALTLRLTALVAVLGFAVGTILAVMRLSANPVLRLTSAFYVWIFRSVPLLVQLLFWYNIGYIVPRISIGIPFGRTLYAGDTRDLITAMGAAILGLTCHEAAHAAEIVRGGIKAVNPGTVEAAHALGLSETAILRHIVFPQAIPAILPAAGNLIIGTLKGTSIVSVIAVSDLLYSAQLIYNDNYQIVPLLMVATMWYAVTTTVMSLLQGLIERHYRPYSREDGGTTRPFAFLRPRPLPPDAAET